MGNPWPPELNDRMQELNTLTNGALSAVQLLDLHFSGETPVEEEDVPVSRAAALVEEALNASVAAPEPVAQEPEVQSA